MKLAWIGYGVMGRAMVQHLANAGHEVHIFTRSMPEAGFPKSASLHFHPSIEEAIADVEFIFTMVGYPSDVEEVYFSPRGILAHYSTTNNAICVDMTTSSPTLAKKIAQALPTSLDAPVSGGDVGAQNASLSIMVGGSQESYEKSSALLRLMGKHIAHCGGAGSGQHTKMANQIAIAGSLSGVCEALTYAMKADLDVSTTIALLSQGAAGSWQMSNNAMKMMLQDYTPGFYMKHFLKDLTIAKEETFAMGLSFPVLNEVHLMVTYLVNNGYANAATQALISYYIEETLNA